MFTIVIIALFFGIKYVVKTYNLRRLPAIDAFEEAIGRAAELGRPAFFTTWMSDLSNVNRYNAIMAGLSCLGHAARLCARYNVKLFTIYNFPEIEPLQDSILRNAYAIEGKSEAYDQTDQLIYTPQWSNVIATINILQKENIGAAFYIGSSFYAQQVYPEMGIRVGAFQIGGTQAMGYYLVMGCDYAMFGEEIYCAGAYISESDDMKRTIVSSDWLKVVTICLITVAVIAVSLGSTFFTNLMVM